MQLVRALSNLNKVYPGQSDSDLCQNARKLVEEALHQMGTSEKLRSGAKEPVAVPPKMQSEEVSRKISLSRREVALGTIPTLKVRLTTILQDHGRHPMKVSEIIEELKRRGWLPRCTDPNTYISFSLGSDDCFKRVKRGFYVLA